jgi:transcriptional regulator with XRE-family HTH domain
MKENNTKEILIQLRKENGLTQSQLADMLGVSYQAVSKWERGENLPDAYTLLDLAKIYGVTVDEILQGKIIPKEDQGKIQTRKKIFSIIGIMMIIMSPISIFLFDINDYQIYVPILLTVIAMGVGLLIYVNVSTMEWKTMEQKSRERRRKEEMVYAVCAGIFLILGLVYGLFHIAWVIFIFGYAVTLSFKDE